MKKLFIAAALLFSSSAIFAQTKFGVKAGVNFANMTLKEDGSSGSYSGSARTTFTITGFEDIAISEAFSFQPGLALTDKGTKEKFSESLELAGLGSYSYSGTSKTGVFYAEIPLNAVAKLQAGQGKLLLGAGPYVGFALSGQSKIQTTEIVDELNSSSETEKSDIEF